MSELIWHTAGIRSQWLLHTTATHARRTLQEFVKSRGSKLNVMHIICGNKSKDDAMSFAFQLVPDEKVEGIYVKLPSVCRTWKRIKKRRRSYSTFLITAATSKMFATVTSKHVYSVGPANDKENSFNSNEVCD